MNQEKLRIGEVATRAGVSVQTMRYYERRRLVEEPLRRPSGYREYPPDTVQLIRFIKRAQELGFTLTEIQELIQLRQNRNRTKVRSIALAKVQDVEQKIRRLRAIRKALSVLIDSCACRSERLECPILEALDDGVKNPAKSPHQEAQ